MEKLSKKKKLKISNDWQHCFPSMTVFRAMWLLKRNGPLLTGIALDGNRDNTSYRVIVHTHNLAIRTNFISLTLWSPLQNARGTYHEEITNKSHDVKFPIAAKRLATQTPVPLTENLRLSDAVSSYEKYAESKRFLIGTPIYLFRDIVSLLTWCNRTEQAQAYLERFLREMSCWNEKVFHQVGGRDTFFRSLNEIIESPERLSEVCKEQASKLRVEGLIDHGFICQ